MVISPTTNPSHKTITTNNGKDFMSARLLVDLSKRSRCSGEKRITDKYFNDIVDAYCQFFVTVLFQLMFIFGLFGEVKIALGSQRRLTKASATCSGLLILFSYCFLATKLRRLKALYVEKYESFLSTNNVKNQNNDSIVK